ncbi:AfsR/SARP family transcriptional regulator [Amycolatopsis australiensis]|uniref:DNA-binding transcriptional activator of the SARP family n=1 Tax=Amycolatopsis australiensis TaxID=546364 RepID=A0A1K1RFJ6_9PSEU|nr:AfsR/SARP family transcriptional regulator [Amycolatopsis australiensis]SFW70721.1 DNA-binding transcriptional activator of the SARP family [Amycolatopsis australiensis]
MTTATAVPSRPRGGLVPHPARATVLGSFDVEIGGVSIVPAAMKAKQLLALLVLNEGRVVQSGTIERELWEEPPRNAANAIQNCVLQIRKKLAAALGEDGCGPAVKRLLRTEPAGYRLDVTLDRSDLRRQRELVAEADELEARGDAAGASAKLQEALDLWQGSPLGDLIPGPVLYAQIVRLLEENKSILMRRVMLDLKLRRYASLIGELRALIPLDEYDESLHASLMFALHMTGRRDAALSVFRNLRRSLHDNLGIEPSRRLQSLHRKVMLDSPADPVRLDDIPWQANAPLTKAGAA